jgi:hypothetical protein
LISIKIITKDDDSPLTYIVISNNSNKKYYFYFFPSIIRSYNIDNLCPNPELHPIFKKIWRNLQPLHPKFKDVLLLKGSKSFSVGKNKIIIRIKNEEGNLYDVNTLHYVLLHELAHTLCDEYGHTHKSFTKSCMNLSMLLIQKKFSIKISQ